MNLQMITPRVHIDHPRIRKSFSCANVQKATLRITGLGLYRAYLNGNWVGDDWLTPGFNDYDDYIRVQTYDVTGMLKADNLLEVWLGNGWYKGRLGFDGGKENRWGDRFLLAAQLEITSINGETRIIETDETWEAFRSPIVSSGIYDGEVRDDTLEPGSPVPCIRTEWPAKQIAPISPQIRVKATLKPVLIHTPAGETVLDFGQNMAGVIRFVNRLAKGQQLRIQTGEVLQEGNFYRDNLRTARSEYIYISDGEEKMVEPLFTFFGFRYAKIESPAEVCPEDFTALCLSSDLKETLQVETGHRNLNRLMQNSLWGQRSNFLDVPTDCPQRDERLGWTADTQVFVSTACYQMDCRDFYRKFMQDMRVDQVRYYSGNIPAFSPSLKGDTIPGGAVWADAGTIIPWKIYEIYGDVDLLRENYPMMRDYTEALIAADQADGGTHLVFSAYTFGDWLAQDGITPQSLKGATDDAYIQGFYYLNSVQLTARAARLLGEEKDAARYDALAAEIRDALLSEYFSPNGNLTMDTQTGYVLALYYGVYRNRDKLLTGFRRRLKKDSFRITCGFTGAPLLLPVLLDNGMEDIAFRMLLSECYPSWLACVNLGATTIWERWNSLNPDGSISGTSMNSLNHYAYGSVCEAIYSRIMGLQLAAPGWKKAVIRPAFNVRLGHVSIRYDSPAGTWEVRWNINASGEICVDASVPEGTTAHVVLPGQPDCDIGPGNHSWRFMPPTDYLHPFSEDSLMMDLMEHPQASAILREQAPEIYSLCVSPDSDMGVLTLREAFSSRPLHNSSCPEEIGKALKAISVDLP